MQTETKSPSVMLKELGESKIEFVRTVEVELSRYNKLIECETELKLLKNAIAKINSYDLSNIIQIFGIEKGK